jgi:Na+-translocating ferredoxin:NAD+ oxidoreductase RnfA subunit
MATLYKILGQSLPLATTNTTLYTTPASTTAIASTLQICNQAATAGTVRVAARPSGAALSTQHYLLYDTSIAANDSLSLSIGMCLATTDVVTIYSSSGSISFTLFGSELT